MMYFDYFIKYLIRMFTRMIFKPRNILIIVIILLVLFFLSSPIFAADDVYSFYDSIANDFIGRLSNVSDDTELMKYLNDSYYNYFLYYGPEYNGTSMTSNNYNTDRLFIAFFPTTFVDTGFSDDNWGGYSGNLTVGSYRASSNGNTNLTIFSFPAGSTSYYKYTQDYLVFCRPLLTYKPSVINTFLQDTRNTEKITSAVTEGTDKIDNTISSTDYDESVVNIDTSSADIDDSSSTQLFTTIFTNFSNLLNSSNWESVETIDIPVPNTDEKIQLRSDILSNIVGNSFIRTLINTAWFSVFGLYAFKFANNIFHSIKSGDILSGLNLNDEVITSTMM